MEKLKSVLARKRVIAIFAPIYAVSQIAIAAVLYPIGFLDMLRLQATLSVDVFRDTIEAWRQAGLLDHYWRHFLLDFPHPAWYAILLAALLGRGLTKINLAGRWLNLLMVPFIAGALDIVENLFHIAFLLDGRAVTPVAVFLSGTASIIKWTLAFLAVVSVMILLILEQRRKDFY